MALFWLSLLPSQSPKIISKDLSVVDSWWTSRPKQTRSRVSYPWPGWSDSNMSWRSEPVSRATLWDELWVEEKFQSNSAIAGSPRNSFWTSVRCFIMVVEHWMGLRGASLVIPTKLRMPWWQSLAVSPWGLSSTGREGKNPDLQPRSLNRCSVCKGSLGAQTTRRLA